MQCFGLVRARLETQRTCYSALLTCDGDETWIGSCAAAGAHGLENVNGIGASHGTLI